MRHFLFNLRRGTRPLLRQQGAAPAERNEPSMRELQKKIPNRSTTARMRRKQVQHKTEWGQGTAAPQAPGPFLQGYCNPWKFLLTSPSMSRNAHLRTRAQGAQARELQAEAPIPASRAPIECVLRTKPLPASSSDAHLAPSAASLGQRLPRLP